MMDGILSSSAATEKRLSAPQSQSQPNTQPHMHTATEAAIDAYAGRVLSSCSPPEACVEPSLAPYITSMLRSSPSKSSPSVLLSADPSTIRAEIDEYDALMELLQEHCSMNADAAQSALRSIAVSVKTGVVDPFGEDTPTLGSSLASGGSSGVGVGGLSPTLGPTFAGSLNAALGGSSSLGPSLASMQGGSCSRNSFDGRGYRSGSLGGEDGAYVSDPVHLLGQMLQDGKAGLGGASSRGSGSGSAAGTQLGSSALALSGRGNGSTDSGINDDDHNTDLPVVEAQSSFLLDEDIPGYSDADKPAHQKQASVALTPGSGRSRHDGGEVTGGASTFNNGVPVLTPLKEDNLIPLDLLGVLDDPSTPAVDKRPTEEKKEETTTTVSELAAKMAKESEVPTTAPTPLSSEKNADFPSIAESASSLTAAATSAAAITKDAMGLPPKKGGGKGSKKKSKKKVDLDLAASLFSTSRSRSNSIPTEKSPMLKPMVAPETLSSSLASHSDAQSMNMGIMSMNLSSGTGGSDMGNVMGGSARKAAGGDSLLSQQIQSTAEILLTMNGSLGEDAAYEASLISNADINIAQYVIDGAMSASPVCRHLLNGGCYRSDCQFSHDVDGHTCMFWLRGRCTKGAGCQFLHGFCAKLLDGINTDFLPGPEAVAQDGQYSLGAAPYDNGPIQTGNLLQYNSTMAYPQTRSTATAPKPLGGGTFASSPFASPSLKPAAPGPQAADFGSFSLAAGGEGPGPVPAQTSSSGSSFANVASSGYDDTSSFAQPVDSGRTYKAGASSKQYASIPQDLWHASEHRDSSVFHIADPLERYNEVASVNPRQDVIDLHFQSVKTFPVVLSTILDGKLRDHGEVWVVTGSGHHVDTSSHQKRGGILEEAVNSWLDSYAYDYVRGRDRNGYGGAVLVKRQQQ
mmetsp:Transcript_32950/g.71305  ORF Transcript_32950/g.71305 Transcript_32950/m.71305 type:complete len:912 (+) Transcript_32950:402-3137(+)